MSTYLIRRKAGTIVFCLVCLLAPFLSSAEKNPWDNGPLKVSGNGHFLMNGDQTPFFWQGETAWLLPERLNRDEVAFYLDKCRQNGYNVIQIQVLNDVPSFNIYGKRSMNNGFDFSNTNNRDEYSYWDHLDYIVMQAAQRGIYVGMVCIWGGLVKNGLMSVDQARLYGSFLAKRYCNEPNIIWIIGGDVTGDVKTDEWEALAGTIRSIDQNHLMTFHPRGRTSSANWFHNEKWLDINMFQSGHRRYGQDNGDKDYPIPLNTEEDNWRYVESAYSQMPHKPVLDGEPSYEDIPQGLHNPDEPRWKAADIRRYAYWSVFAGSCGHTYGHNSIMQFLKPGVTAAYGATKYWYEALNDPGFSQMQYLKKLMLAFPYFERVPDQQIVAGTNGEKYDRAIATRGFDYLLVYNDTGKEMKIDLSRISGEKKMAWWYNPRNGALEYIGSFDSAITSFRHNNTTTTDTDYVLIVTDASNNYIQGLKEP
ncbi:MAG TPA: glycoside hydrolase family 140 protein [Prolixibacteraceae bacterium]|nr:glycoside hydrolase family 140 protein [Prolixibacteraceae bacterium]